MAEQRPVWTVPDTIECICGQVVYRYRDGTKTNTDGSEHKHGQAPAGEIDTERAFILE